MHVNATSFPGPAHVNSYCVIFDPCIWCVGQRSPNGLCMHARNKANGNVRVQLCVRVAGLHLNLFSARRQAGQSQQTASLEVISEEAKKGEGGEKEGMEGTGRKRGEDVERKGWSGQIV